jgi:hypothetical protein
VSADVLRRRPDIRAAERRLAAQTAQVGVATAALYPSLSLAGSISLQSTSAGDVFDGFQTSRGLLSLAMPIFHADALRQNVAAQNALVDQALATYESTVLTAYEDVENALNAWNNEQRRHEALVASAASARVASDLALMQYNSGLVDFQTVPERGPPAHHDRGCARRQHRRAHGQRRAALQGAGRRVVGVSGRRKPRPRQLKHDLRRHNPRMDTPTNVKSAEVERTLSEIEPAKAPPWRKALPWAIGALAVLLVAYFWLGRTNSGAVEYHAAGHAWCPDGHGHGDWQSRAGQPGGHRRAPAPCDSWSTPTTKPRTRCSRRSTPRSRAQVPQSQSALVLAEARPAGSGRCKEARANGWRLLRSAS